MCIKKELLNNSMNVELYFQYPEALLMISPNLWFRLKKIIVKRARRVPNLKFFV